MKSIILPLLVTAIAVAGCDRMDKRGHAKADPAAIEQELKAIEAAWMADYNARDPSKLVTYYAADAALANPGSAIATDPAAIKAELTKFVSDPTLKLEFASDKAHIAKSGDLAVTRGHFSMQTTDATTKQPRTDTGSYMTVWKKQADGSWKAVEDFVTPGAPPAAAPAAQ